MINNYHSIKLIILEKAYLIREIVQITLNQPGFVKNCGITDAIHVKHFLMTKHGKKYRPLHIAFLWCTATTSSARVCWANYYTIIQGEKIETRQVSKAFRIFIRAPQEMPLPFFNWRIYSMYLASELMVKEHHWISGCFGATCMRWHSTTSILFDELIC